MFPNLKVVAFSILLGIAIAEPFSRGGGGGHGGGGGWGGRGGGGGGGGDGGGGWGGWGRPWPSASYMPRYTQPTLSSGQLYTGDGSGNDEFNGHM